MNNYQEVHRMVANPDLVRKSDLTVLNQLKNKYPYFQAIHTLIAKAESTSENIKTAACYTTDRVVLQMIIRSEFNPNINLPSLDSIDIPTEDLNAFDKLSTDHLSETSAASAENQASLADNETNMQLEDIQFNFSDTDYHLPDASEGSPQQSAFLMANEETEEDPTIAPLKEAIVNHTPDALHTNETSTNETPESTEQQNVATPATQATLDPHSETVLNQSADIMRRAMADLEAWSEKHKAQKDATGQNGNIDEAIKALDNMGEHLSSRQQAAPETPGRRQPLFKAYEQKQKEREAQEQQFAHLREAASPTQFALNDLLPQQDQADIKAKQQAQIAIIDKFIADMPFARIEEGKESTVQATDFSEAHSVMPDAPTENLASILVKQGKIDSAIEIYQRLILKFPHKTAYFAARIDNLKQLK